MNLEVGKKYRIVSHEAAENLGMRSVVEIVREEDGMFLGDNGNWYLPNGVFPHEVPMISANTLNLGSEVID